MNAAFAGLPAPHPATELVVAIPARDEAALLPGALAALAVQTDRDGRRLARTRFEVVVFANSCRDGTARVARAFARERAGDLTIHVVEGDLPRDTTHIGEARGDAMDAAVARFARIARPDGIVATTDADSLVDARWVAETLAGMAHAEAVTGRIELAAAELASLPHAVRDAYRLDDEYRTLVAWLEATRDPVPYDPWPRHAHHFGASFAVRAHAYRRAGGLPRVSQMEDIALYVALHRIDARVRHDPAVRVTTSARTIARVRGGLATRLAAYATTAGSAPVARVETPTYTLARIDARAALRRIWNGRPERDDRARVTTTYGVTNETFERLFDARDPFGANAQRLEYNGDRAFRDPDRVPITDALASLRTLRAQVPDVVSMATIRA